MTRTINPATVERAYKEDQSALEELIGGVWPHAYRIAVAIVRDRTLAEDVAQEACASIARGLSALRDLRTFEGWWRRIVGNKAVDAARRRSDLASIDSLSQVPIASDDAQLIDLHAAIIALPLTQRVAVVLHYYAGLTSSEIAAAVGQPSATVRFHLMLARRTLRARLDVGAADETRATTKREMTSHAR